MNLFQQLSLGIESFFKAVSFMFKNGMAWFFLFPVILNIVLFVGGFWAVGSVVDTLWDYLDGWMDSGSWDFWGAETIAFLLGGLFWLLFRVLFFLIFSYVSGYVVLILLSPVMAWLSEKTDRILTGSDHPFAIEQFVTDIVRGLGVALRNFFLETLWTIGILILSFVPVVGLITPVLLFVLASYYYGFSFMDYNFERRKMNIGQSVTHVRRHKGLAVGLATPFSVLLLIPLIGPSLAGFAALVSTVGATLAQHKLDQKGS